MIAQWRPTGAGKKSRRQAPLARARGGRIAQPQPFGQGREHAAARHRCVDPGQAEPLRGKVEGVARVRADLQVWVIGQPRALLGRQPIHRPYLAHVQPAPQGMEGTAAGQETPAALMQLRRPEHAEKQEQVARANALIAQMPLGRAGLAQNRPPAGRTRQGAGDQIRVQVRAVAAAHPSAGQVPGHFTQAAARQLYVVVADARVSIRNRQHTQATVRKHRARTTTGGRIEPFSTENQPHPNLRNTSAPMGGKCYRSKL